MASGLTQSCASIIKTFSSKRNCNPSNPGVGTMYLTNVENVVSIVVSTANTITSIVMASGTTFYEYAPYVFTAQADETSTVTDAGNTSTKHNVKFNLNAVSDDSVDAGYRIHRSASLAIIKYNNGRYVLFGTVDTTNPGLSTGLLSKKFDILNGVKDGDNNFVQMELEASVSRPAYSINPAIVAALVTVAA